MQKIRDISLIGVRSDGGQTKGSATNGVTMTTPPSRAIYFIPSGGTITIRRADEAPAEAVTWPQDVPFTAEGYLEAMGASEFLPSFVVTIPAAVTVTGWMIGGQPVIA